MSARRAARRPESEPEVVAAVRIACGLPRGWRSIGYREEHPAPLRSPVRRLGLAEAATNVRAQ